MVVRSTSSDPLAVGSAKRPFFLSRPYLAAVLTQDQTLQKGRCFPQRRSRKISGFRLDLALIGIKDQWFSGRPSVGHVLLVQRASKSFLVHLTSWRIQALSIRSFHSPRPGSNSVWRGHPRPSQLCSRPKSSVISAWQREARMARACRRLDARSSRREPAPASRCWQHAAPCPAVTASRSQSVNHSTPQPRPH